MLHWLLLLLGWLVGWFEATDQPTDAAVECMMAYDDRAAAAIMYVQSVSFGPCLKEADRGERKKCD
jgi:hypothetical protein